LVAVHVRDAAADIEVTLYGEIDLASAEVVDDLQCLFEHRPRALRVDLAAVTFLDARGIASMLDLQKRGRACGCEVGFTNAHGIVAKAITLCDLDSILLGADSRD
jgi:anti-anti-sigma factor